MTDADGDDREAEARETVHLRLPAALAARVRDRGRELMVAPGDVVEACVAKAIDAIKADDVPLVAEARLRVARDAAMHAAVRRGATIAAVARAHDVAPATVTAAVAGHEARNDGQAFAADRRDRLRPRP